MAKYKVTICRTEYWTKEIEVEAEVAHEAVRNIRAAIDVGGWSAVCGDDDGDLQTSTITVSNTVVTN